MKTLIPALLLSAAIPAVCQTPQPPIDPNQIFPMPHQFQQSPRDPAKPPSFQFPSRFFSLPRIVRPPRKSQLGDPHFDVQIIHRPPPDSFAQQKPRTPPASNLYPDLKLLPIETARLDPIPTEWPKLKEEPIPITWPDAKVSTIQGVAPNAVPKE